MNTRLQELLIDQAVFGLDSNEAAELEALLDSGAENADNPFMETAALIQLGLAATDRSASGDGMPAALRDKLQADARLKR